MPPKEIPPHIRDLHGEEAYTVLARVVELEKKGKNIVKLQIGQPDFLTPEPVVKAAVASLERGDHGYAPTLGIWELRQAIAKAESEKRGFEVSPECVAIMPGGKTGIFVAMSLVLQQGEEVIYPDPGFPSYRNVCDFLSAVPKPLPIVEDKNFSFDHEAFDSLVSPKTKLIVLNSPSNPTGGVISKDDLTYVAEAAKKNGSWVISDEIYEELVFDGERAPSIYDLPGMPERTLVLNSFSKTYAMTGWRLGYIIAPRELMPVIDVISTNMFACATTFTQYGALAAFSLTKDVERMRSEYAKRRDYLVAALNNVPGVSCTMPKGAFYAFPNIKSFGLTSEEIAERLLTEFDVAVLPGTAFGPQGEGYLRLSYATSMENLEEGIRRLTKGFASLKK